MKVSLHILGWYILLAEVFAQQALPIGLWSQPQTISPAQAGLVDGRFRAAITHAFRPATGFVRFASSWASLEAPFTLANLPAGIGAYFLSDVAGGWRTTKGMVNLAYEAPLGARARYDHLRAGFGVGFVQRTVEPNDLYYEDQFDGRSFSRPTTENFSQTSLWHADYSVGLLYYRTQKVPGNVELCPFGGFAVAQLNRPAVGLLVRRAERLSLFWTGYGGARLFTRTPFEFIASFLYARSNQSQWIGGSLLTEFVIYEGGYWFTRPAGSILAGVSLRARDQYALVAGFTLQKGLAAGLAYSLLTRRATTPTTFGGLQVMMQYQLGYSYKERGIVYPFPIW
ncbi:MAG: type IX secretion system membrane protein PorP/SprF [Bacteroidia bacterium]|nr:type IX secretion system membrane protein PorP/SprF [Bacteroidia bacterium]MDW8134702.1 type IX secretion system membrane protein PorP/SprF [Bacteroidia bacterium]